MLFNNCYIMNITRLEGISFLTKNQMIISLFFGGVSYISVAFMNPMRNRNTNSPIQTKFTDPFRIIKLFLFLIFVLK